MNFDKLCFRFEDESCRGYPKGRFHVGLMLARYFYQPSKMETIVAGYGIYLRFFGKAFVLFYITATYTRDITNFMEIAE